MMVDTDCNDILEQCAPSFKNMVQILQSIGNFFKALREFLFAHQLEINRSFQYLDDLITKIGIEDVQVEINNYLKQEGDEKMKTAASLCSKFLNIEGLTFLEKTQAILQGFIFNKIERRFNNFYNLSNKKNRTPATPPLFSQQSKAPDSLSKAELQARDC